MGFLKIYGANMGPNAKKLTKNSIYRAAIKLWYMLATLAMVRVSPLEKFSDR